MKRFIITICLSLFCFLGYSQEVEVSATHMSGVDSVYSVYSVDSVDATEVQLIQVRDGEILPPVEPAYRVPDQVTSGVLAILLGDIGVHRFYRGEIGLGIIDVLFCWTGIPGIVALINGIIWLIQDPDLYYDNWYYRNAERLEAS